MQIRCGLESEAFKYNYGKNTTWELPFDENKRLKLTCAKNDWAAAQLLLYSEAEMMVCINDDPCFYERYPIDIVRVKVDIPGIKKEDIQLNLVGLIKDDDGLKKSDMLLKQPFIHVESRKLQAVWIEVKTDKDLLPGVYNTNITISKNRLLEDETALKTLSYEIEVVDVSLDDPAQYGYYLDLWQHNSSIARTYEVQLWSDRHFEIIENYVAALADLGQKAITVIASEIPWSGQWSSYNRLTPSNTFEYNIVKVRRKKDSKWEYDFSALNRYIKLCMKYGINKEIEVFGLMNIWLLEDVGYGRVIKDYDDGIRIRYYDEETCTYKYIRERCDLVSYISALEQNFVQNGWSDIVRVICDEPSDVEKFKNRLNELRSMAPSFQFKVAINHIEFIREDIPGVADYVPGLPCVCQEFKKTMDIKKDLAGRLYYYVCCGPERPNTFFCSPLIEGRLISWLSWYMNLDGFLRWNFTVWPNNPFEEDSYHHQTFPAGDTTFVYPGKDGKPVFTLRYMNLKRGIRDFEIFNRYVKQSGSREKILEMMKKVFLWHDIYEMHPDERRKADELYSLSWEDYDSIARDVLYELK